MKSRAARKENPETTKKISSARRRQAERNRSYERADKQDKGTSEMPSKRTSEISYERDSIKSSAGISERDTIEDTQMLQRCRQSPCKVLSFNDERKGEQT